MMLAPPVAFCALTSAGNPVGFRGWRAAVWVTNGSQVH